VIKNYSSISDSTDVTESAISFDDYSRKPGTATYFWKIGGCPWFLRLFNMQNIVTASSQA